GLVSLKDMPNLEDVRWEGSRVPTPETKRFHAGFILYLPANAHKWKDVREKFDRGELKFD
ncbi:MAG: hypothetical protein L0211_14145, partial [Planctomycetaceae bacterium]|nr:hypothetical protein [Planctomycetaceae bacterium]